MESYNLISMHVEKIGRSVDVRGSMLDLGSNGHLLEIHRRHCVVSLSPWARHIFLCLVLVQPIKTGKHPGMTEKLLIRT